MEVFLKVHPLEVKVQATTEFQDKDIRRMTYSFPAPETSVFSILSFLCGLSDSTGQNEQKNDQILRYRR